MPKPSMVVLTITDRALVTEAAADPIGFVEAHRDELDELAAEQFRTSSRHQVSRGRGWGLLLPGDSDVSTLQATFGPDFAASVAEAAQHAPPDSMIVYTVVETIPKGRG